MPVGACKYCAKLIGTIRPASIMPLLIGTEACNYRAKLTRPVSPASIVPNLGCILIVTPSYYAYLLVDSILIVTQNLEFI